MWYVSEEIIKACEYLKYSYKVLNDQEMCQVLQGIKLDWFGKRIGEYIIYNPSLWCSEEIWVKHDPQVWNKLRIILDDEPVYLLPFRGRDIAIFSLNNGKEAADILYECFSFSFCLTNHSFDYLLSFNDSDMLVIMGDIKREFILSYANIPQSSHRKNISH